MFAEEGTPAVAPPDMGGAERERVLMVTQNVVLNHSCKVVVTGADLAQVLAQVSTQLKLPSEIVLAPALPHPLPAGSIPQLFTSLDQVSAKAKVQVWPALMFARRQPRD